MDPSRMPERHPPEHLGPGRPLNLPAAIEVVEGGLQAAGKRFVIVASCFNGALVDRLVEGAVECLIEHGAAAGDIQLFRVPGAWELPLALDQLADESFDAAVALGLVIRGETAHFDYICAEVSHGIAKISVDYSWPIGFGLLTCENAEQAKARCGGKVGNKGWEAAEAAISMTNLRARLDHLAAQSLQVGGSG